jgi:hypothetical protein
MSFDIVVAMLDGTARKLGNGILLGLSNSHNGTGSPVRITSVANLARM